jgi:perosamine synthetase
VPQISVNTPLLNAEDRQAVATCLESGWVSSEGPQVGQFEALFAQTCRREHAIAVTNGTAGLEIAVRALGLGPGDEVILPSMTIISCAQAIVKAGAKPVLVDCDPTDWNAHLAHFRAHLTPRTRAIMLVHIYGLCADLGPILAWAKEAGLMVIEDACEALGLQYRGEPCGSFGDISVFSLYANKIVTTGEGGMIVCNDPALANRCRSLRNLCFDPAKRYWHEDLGWNYRFTAMQAAMGIPQLRRLPDLVKRKHALGKVYREAFEQLPQLQLAPAAFDYCENVYWVFGVVLTAECSFSRSELTAFLAREGIGTRTFFYGLHEQPALLKPRHIEPGALPVTESLSQRGFYLPSGLGLTSEDQQRVVDVLTAFVEVRA